jgi:hypothetical protein
MATQYTNILQDHPKYIQIGIFGLKINHLATLTRIIFRVSFLPLERISSFRPIPQNVH